MTYLIGTFHKSIDLFPVLHVVEEKVTLKLIGSLIILGMKQQLGSPSAFVPIV